MKLSTLQAKALPRPWHAACERLRKPNKKFAEAWLAAADDTGICEARLIDKSIATPASYALAAHCVNQFDSLIGAVTLVLDAVAIGRDLDALDVRCLRLALKRAKTVKL